MKYTPERGDIVHMQFDPASGQEMKGDHFGLVVSSRQFNSRGMAVVCPISQGIAESARTFGTIVTLMGSGTDTQGSVHCHQMKSLDWRVRKAKLKERAPSVVIDEVMARIQAILVG